MHPILGKHEDQILLYETLMGPVLGDLMFAVTILSDVQHMISPDPHIPEVAELNEAKALILRAFNFIVKEQGS